MANIKKENIIVAVPADLKRAVRRAIKRTDFRSITHLVETQLRAFVASQEPQKPQAETAKA